MRTQKTHGAVFDIQITPQQYSKIIDIFCDFHILSALTANPFDSQSDNGLSELGNDASSDISSAHTSSIECLLRSCEESRSLNDLRDLIEGLSSSQIHQLFTHQITQNYNTDGVEQYASLFTFLMSHLTTDLQSGYDISSHVAIIHLMLDKISPEQLLDIMRQNAYIQNQSLTTFASIMGNLRHLLIEGKCIAEYESIIKKIAQQLPQHSIAHLLTDEIRFGGDVFSNVLFALMSDFHTIIASESDAIRDESDKSVYANILDILFEKINHDQMRLILQSTVNLSGSSENVILSLIPPLINLSQLELDSSEYGSIVASLFSKVPHDSAYQMLIGKSPISCQYNFFTSILHEIHDLKINNCAGADQYFQILILLLDKVSQEELYALITQETEYTESYTSILFCAAINHFSNLIEKGKYTATYKPVIDKVAQTLSADQAHDLLTIAIDLPCGNTSTVACMILDNIADILDAGKDTGEYLLALEPLLRSVNLEQLMRSQSNQSSTYKIEDASRNVALLHEKIIVSSTSTADLDNNIRCFETLLERGFLFITHQDLETIRRSQQETRHDCALAELRLAVRHHDQVTPITSLTITQAQQVIGTKENTI